MSIELSILPVNEEYESYSHEILKKIKSSIPFPLDIEIVKDYCCSLNTRISKQKQLDKIIIVVDSSYLNNSNIIVRFSDKGSKAKKMNINEFIDIFSSFEDEYLKENNSEKDVNLKVDKDNNKNEEENDSGCNIS